MKLTIVPDDSFVAVDSDDSHRPLNLSDCNIPSDVHALQWFDTKGWIEFDDPADPFSPKPPNQIIEALPQWANNCVAVFNAWTPPPPPPPKPKAEQPNTTGTEPA